MLSVSFSPYGDEFVSGTKDGQIRIWSLDNFNFPQTIVNHEDKVTSVKYNPDGQWIFSVSYDQTYQMI